MKIELNGEGREIRVRTLGELCDTLGYGGTRVATAVNGAFVAKRERPACQLAENDRVEIVSPRQGG